jgi:hypothetical protein
VYVEVSVIAKPPANVQVTEKRLFTGSSPVEVMLEVPTIVPPLPKPLKILSVVAAAVD